MEPAARRSRGLSNRFGRLQRQFFLSIAHQLPLCREMLLKALLQLKQHKQQQQQEQQQQQLLLLLRLQQSEQA